MECYGPKKILYGVEENKRGIYAVQFKVSELSEIMLYRGLAGCQRNKEVLRKS